MRNSTETDFRRQAESGGLVFDKTKWIRRILEDGRYVSLITRPHGFGKTYTQMMLQAFFERHHEDPSDSANTRRLFRDTAVLTDAAFCNKHMAQWPVVFLPFSRVQGVTFEEAMQAMAAV